MGLIYPTNGGSDPQKEAQALTPLVSVAQLFLCICVEFILHILSDGVPIEALGELLSQLIYLFFVAVDLFQLLFSELGLEVRYFLSELDAP